MCLRQQSVLKSKSEEEEKKTSKKLLKNKDIKNIFFGFGALLTLVFRLFGDADRSIIALLHFRYGGLPTETANVITDRQSRNVLWGYLISI